MKYPLLHETLKVGSIVLKNRLVMPPMATEKSAKGQVTDGLSPIMATWPAAARG